MGYRVIGYFEESSRALGIQLDATDAHQAMFEVAKGRKNGDLVIVGAITPDGLLVAPCEDSGTTASAETLYQKGAVVKAKYEDGSEDCCTLYEFIVDHPQIGDEVERMEQGERVNIARTDYWMPCWSK